MKTIIQSNLKIKLIALGLLFIIPITINLGIDFIYPEITEGTFWNAKIQYFKENIPGYDPRNPDNKKELQFYTKWFYSNEKKALEKEEHKQQKFKLIILISIILFLVILINFIKIPIIKSSLIGSILYLSSASFYYVGKNALFSNVHLQIVGILSSLICLILITYYAYRDRNL